MIERGFLHLEKPIDPRRESDLKKVGLLLVIEEPGFIGQTRRWEWLSSAL